jgi:hypothetical protein
MKTRNLENIKLELPSDVLILEIQLIILELNIFQSINLLFFSNYRHNFSM